MKLWPSFSTKSKALDTLTEEIKSLQEKLEDNDLDSELRDLEFKSFTSSDSSSSLSGMAGIVDEFYDKAMLQKLYATETWFFIAVHTIAKTIAALPLKVEKRKKTTQNISQSDGTSDRIQRETWIDASAEPEYDILTKPNSIQSSVEFWMLVIIDLMATGDAFIFVDNGDPDDSELEDDNSPRARLRQSINSIRKSKVRGLYRLSAGMVRPQPAPQDTKILGGYTINTEHGIFFFEADDVIHIKLPNPCDPFFGLSPIIPVMKNVLLDKYSAEHMIRFYKQGARLGGVIHTEKKLTKDQLVRLERVFESNFTGKRNHHKTLILPEGMKYDTIEQNPGETSLIEFLRANKEPILAAFNMPPIKVGLLDGATYSNAMIQDKTYYNDTIKPICRIVEDSINQHGSIISKMRELRFRFSFDDIEALKENEVDKAGAAKGMLDSGMSINEVREKVWKLPPAKGGDIIPSIENAKAPVNPLFGPKSASAGDEKTADAIQNIVHLNGTQLHSMVEIIKNIKDETISESSALHLLQIGFNLTREQAEKILGIATVETKTDVVNTQNDTTALSDIKPTEGTFESRVSELVAVAIQAGIAPDIAVPKAISQAMLEGFMPGVAEEKKTEESELKDNSNNFTKEFLIGFQKATTGEGVDHLIEDRLKETEEYFDRLEKYLMKLWKKKNKSHVTKAGFTSDDLEAFLTDELDRLYDADMKALRHGYKQSISSRPMTFPNEKALAILKEESAKKIKYITETTRNQINGIISDSFGEQVAVTEISSRIRDVFPDMKSGRALTIARTETLSAVSMGQNLKVQEFKQQFPREAAKMKRMWITAQDDRVRDTHISNDGVSVEIGEKFPNGLEYPRDPSGDASEVINCRCTSIEYFPEDKNEIESTMSNGSPLAQDVDQADI